MADLNIYQIDINVNRKRYEDTYNAIVSNYAGKMIGSNFVQFPKEYYRDLNGCNSIVSKFCYNYPQHCYDLMNEYIAQTSDFNDIKNPIAVTGQICDESEKPENSKITNTFQKTNLYDSCKGKFITNVCVDPLKRYVSAFSNKEKFAGSCLDMCNSDQYKDDIDLQLACTTGMINFCLNGTNIYDPLCKYDLYFDNEDQILRLKDIQKKSSMDMNVVTDFLKKRRNDIITFKKKYCDTQFITKPSYCISDQVNSSATPVVAISTPSMSVATAVDMDNKSELKPTSNINPKEKESSTIVWIIIFIILICVGIAFFIKIKMKMKIEKSEDESIIKAIN